MESNKIGGSTITSAAKTPAQAAQSDEAFVTSLVPRGFTLFLRPGLKVTVKAGTQELPVSIANHWYAKAHGVTTYVPESGKEDAETADEADEEASDEDAGSNESASSEKRRPGRPPKAQ